MSDNSKIEWTDSTWNPIVGCSVLSPGCTNCYAMRIAPRTEHLAIADDWTAPGPLTKPSKAGPVWTGNIRLIGRRLTQPLQWRSPRMIFVNSMGDLFHESVPDGWIDRVFAIMAACRQHTFQVLTKRAMRMREYCGTRPVLPNVWLGVSAERQQEARERIPMLLQTPAAVRFVSLEPLLGPINLTSAIHLDWVIVGGESGPHARPMHPDWARSLRDQCAAAGVPFFFKQHGEWLSAEQVPATPIEAPPDRVRALDLETAVARVGRRVAGRLLDGVEHNGFPELRA